MTKPAVLIVEDEPGIADTLQYALRTDGFEPHWVATGEAALARQREAPAALVILDVGLPDLNGFEVFKRLRALPSDVPVVFLTARSDEIDRVVGLELGADDYVAKPFSPRELVARRAHHPAPRASRTPAPAARRHAALPPFAVDEGAGRSASTASALDLSRYEYGLLQTLVAAPRPRVHAATTLLDKVWDDGSDSLDRTVDAHVKTLRAKLKAVAPQLEPIRTPAAAATRWPKTCRPAREPSRNRIFIGILLALRAGRRPSDVPRCSPTSTRATASRPRSRWSRRRTCWPPGRAGRARRRASTPTRLRAGVPSRCTRAASRRSIFGFDQDPRRDAR